jgi:UDP-N-acetylglucosamine:LPS N-acetylglucosamine transferase
MAEAVERFYPGRFEMRVSDYMKDVGIVGLDGFHKDSWRRALARPFLARWGQRLIDAFPRVTIAAQRRLLRGFARAAAGDLRDDDLRLIVSNHGLLTTGFAEAKRLYGLDVPVLTFATEPFNISAYWGDPRAERVLAASEESRRKLIRFGVPAERITVVGRPVRQAFLEAPPKREARRRLGLAEDRFTCVVSLGGEGVGTDPRRIARALLGEGAQVILLSGRNAALREELLGLGEEGLRVEGFVEDVALRLAASDVFVGKAGPSSVYEALAVGRPVLATGYAGLNELGVARFISERGLGRYVGGRTEALTREVRRYADDPALLEKVALRCRALDLKGSTERFAHHIVAYATNGA